MIKLPITPINSFINDLSINNKDINNGHKYNKSSLILFYDYQLGLWFGVCLIREKKNIGYDTYLCLIDLYKLEVINKLFIGTYDLILHIGSYYISIYYPSGIMNLYSIRKLDNSYVLNKI